jgi:hypothetical protein
VPSDLAGIAHIQALLAFHTGALDGKLVAQALAGAGQARAERADGDFEDFGGRLVGQFLDDDQQQDLTVIRIQRLDRRGRLGRLYLLGRFATEWNRYAVPPVAKNRPKHKRFDRIQPA